MWGQMRVARGGPARAGRQRGAHPRGDRGEPGQRPVDAYFDLGLADDLATRFSPPRSTSIRRAFEALIADDRCLVGLSAAARTWT